MNKCVICGEYFEPTARHPHQKTCSPDCRKLYAKKNRPKKKYVPRKVICRICGKETSKVYMNADGHRIREYMHDECVMKECRKRILNHEPLGVMWYQRLYSRGYTKADLVQIMKP